MITRFFFRQEYSLNVSGFGAAITYSLMTGRYIAAALLFVACVGLETFGQLRLEKLDYPW